MPAYRVYLRNRTPDDPDYEQWRADVTRRADAYDRWLDDQPADEQPTDPQPEGQGE